MAEPLPTPRFELMHRQLTRFRAAVLIELAIGTLCTCGLLPLVLVVLAVAHALDLPLPGFDELLARAFTVHHEVVLRRVDGANSSEERFEPADPAAGEALFARALERAAVDGLLLVEGAVGGEARAIWDPRRPLAEPAGGPEPAALLAAAEAGGYRVSREDGALTLTVDATATPPFVAGMLLVVAAPFAIWAATGRSRLRDLALDLRGEAPEQLRLRAEAGNLRFQRLRGGEVREEHHCARVRGLALLALPAYQETAFQLQERRSLPPERLHVRGDPAWSVVLPGPRETQEAARALIVRALGGALW